MNKDFDVVVIGAGHAGLEAAFIISKFNLKVGLFNMNKNSIANLPCNPSIGGPAKGVVTREIDALGGIQGIAADSTKIQNKKLNHSKGPGVWAYRAQIDKEEFHRWFLDKIEKNKNIQLIFEEVLDLIKDSNTVSGVKTKTKIYSCKSIIITTGTYLKSELYHDKKFANSGPDKNPSSNLSDILKRWNIDLIRLKTGTPPRISKESIDFSKLTKDEGNDEKIAFSFVEPRKIPLSEQIFCYLTETTEKTREIIFKNKEKLGIYNGSICAVGPRYCPSIEDKFIKFPHRKKHFIFVEPVSKNSDLYYLAGLSTSLSKDLQTDLVRSIIGLEKAEIKNYAYAISYDAVNPVQCHKTLECKKINNLYFAGQINGTSGYEEAAAQGLIAGINAALKILNRKPFILKRSESYIGVLIDDITSKGVQEPYRLLTSRAEHRLFLRNDNADERLMKYGYELGTIDEEFYKKFLKQQENINFNINFLKNNFAAKYKLVSSESGTLTLFSWLSRISNKYEELKILLKDKLKELSEDSVEKLMIKVKYEGYIKSQEARIKKLDKWKNIELLDINDYSVINNLSNEAVEKLNKEKPILVDDALRISGININDIFWIKAYLDSKYRTKLKEKFSNLN